MPKHVLTAMETLLELEKKAREDMGPGPISTFLRSTEPTPVVEVSGEPEEKVTPIPCVLGDGFMTVRDNTLLSGAVVHPYENMGKGDYLAPLGENPQAAAVRLHEAVHLHLLTSGIQPLFVGKFFFDMGVDNGWYQAMADAKVMAHCQKNGLAEPLKHLMLVEGEREHMPEFFRRIGRVAQAQMFLRSIGTDQHEIVGEFADKISPRQKKYLLAVFDEIKHRMATTEDWFDIGSKLQSTFETPTSRRAREKKEDKIMPKGKPGAGEACDSPEKSKGEGKGEDEDEDETPETPEEKEKREKKAKAEAKKKEKLEAEERRKAVAKAMAKKAEELKDSFKPPKIEDMDYRPMAGKAGGASAAGKLGEKDLRPGETEKKSILKVLEEFEKKTGEDPTPAMDMAKEILEKKGSFDQSLDRMGNLHGTRTIEDALYKMADGRRAGVMEIHKPPLEKNFEPKERAKKAKRSFTGSFRYPQRMMTDKAVFASKLRGKGGTLIIDCSGSMHITYEDVKKVLEQRPYATIGLYGSTNGYHDSGGLFIIVDRGKCVTEPELRRVMDKFSGGNVVDLPALEWLCKRSGMKFWICDGAVTGQGDSYSTRVSYPCMVLEKRYHVKRWRSMRGFLDGKKPDYNG